MRTSRLIATGILGGGNLRYQMRDLFSTDRAAGAVNGTAAEPGPGTRTVVDTENKISISGGELVFAGGKAVPGFGDPRMRWASIARASGLALLFRFTPNALSSDGVYLGWSKDAAPGSGASFQNLGYRLMSSSGVKIQFWNGAVLSSIGNVTVSTSGEFGIILSDVGAALLGEGGLYRSDVYTLLYATRAGTNTPVYPGISNSNGVFDVEDVRVRQFTAPRWTGGGYSLAQGYIETPTAGAELTAPKDCFIEFTWTPGAGETLELDVRRKDADNRLIIRCAQAGGTIKIIKREAGVESETYSDPQPWTVGTPYKISVVMDVRKIQLYVNDSEKAPHTTAIYNTGYTTVRVSHAGANFSVSPRHLYLNSGEPYTRLSPDRAYVVNAAAPCVIPSYDGADQALHPDVYYNAAGWNGYEYWMAFTPYTNSDSAFENPSIVASHDGQTWEVPAGLTNPIDPTPAGSYNSDTDLIVDQSGVMWCIYREAREPNNKILARSSTNGVTWSEEVELMQLPAHHVSPAMLWDGGQYVMYLVDDTTTPNTVERYTAEAVSGPWVYQQDCTLTMPGGKEPWHIDVIGLGGNYYMLIQDLNWQLFFATSPDGLTWNCGSGVMLAAAAAGSWDELLYRACLVATPTGFRMWYTGRNNDGGSAVNKVGVTDIGF